tara:strand:+ start:799 stop:2103 length:1305 start_codon:yes stop_codon:yes gene_type:complete
MAVRYSNRNNNNARLAVDRFGNQVSMATNRPGPTNTQLIQEQAQILANQIIQEQQLAEEIAAQGRIFTNFGTGDIRGEYEEVVTKGLFSGNTGSFTTMFTSSLLTATQKTYYQELSSIADPANNSQAASELSIAYGQFDGSGSVDLTGNLNNDTPTRAIYRQYAQLLLAPNDKKFTFNGVDSDSIYILNFNRARIREKVDPGNFEVSLGQLSGSQFVEGAGGNAGRNQDHTGSNVQLDGSGVYVQVIDDSSINDPSATEGGLVYNLVSGSIDGGTSIFQPTDPVYYGLLYPQHGVAILNGDVLDTNVNFATVSGSQVQGDNTIKLFHSISSSHGLVDTATRTGGIQARSSEKVTATYYFVRVKNGEYNYSNNPTFTTGSLGEVAFSSFAADPQVYITSIGMYNAQRELLAVAKLSQPLLKSFTREALIKVKLDF